MRTKIKPLVEHGPVVFKNASYLIESISLLIAAYFNYTTAYHAHLSSVGLKVRVAASLVIGLRGAYEMIRYLANKEVK